ncbi:hypothetical protein [Methanococcus maripaludis]|uniref:Uncharacterized protein n=2 Tax=Methanococcus maripaludis TaxID=39152 RepID=A0A2Z5PIL4_METMI|nr:hypothetical protein [Methanococcus maripaludis]MDK2929748.1 hypothetical protein [Methanococcus sp.]BAP61859.1 hypothetical protein MMKA1_17420 [Methanococcus maripaludis KA1]BAP63710.1 hypothetical protein MMOS7_16240 [Methanococcus maripaludis OS7]
MRIYSINRGKYIVTDSDFEKYLGEYKLIRGVKKVKVRDVSDTDIEKTALLEELRICGKVVEWLNNDIERIVKIFNE